MDWLRGADSKILVACKMGVSGYFMIWKSMESISFIEYIDMDVNV